jgi:hypothetical protein
VLYGFSGQAFYGFCIGNVGYVGKGSTAEGLAFVHYFSQGFLPSGRQYQPGAPTGQLGGHSAAYPTGGTGNHNNSSVDAASVHG